MRNHLKNYSWWSALAIAAGIGGVVWLGNTLHFQGNATAQAAASSAGGSPQVLNLKNPDIVAAQQLSRAFEEIQRSIKNSVVNINVIKIIKSPAMRMHIQLPPGFHQFFQVPPGFRFRVGPGPLSQTPPQGGPEKLFGTGSGVIIGANGYIVTNNHVVSHATSIKVTLADGRTYKAKLIGRDPKTDLAVIKIPVANLTPAVLGNSSHVHIGQWVLAFGSPFGLSHTMTQGIISAKGRAHIIAAHNPKLLGLTYGDFLQTDAAINPGNSGGPLVNMRGHVIGINTAIATNTGSFAGIGFSIPSNEVKYVSHALIKYGKVVRGYLGVGIADIRIPGVRKVARTFHFMGKHGVLVEQVMRNTPAAKAGMKPGDIIVAFDGKKVMRLNELRNEVAQTRPGTKVTLQVVRDGKTFNLTFPVGTQPATHQLAMEGVSSGPSSIASHSLGITVSTVTPAMARQYHMSAPRGVVVTRLDPNSIAASAGINPGEIILNVQGHRVNSAAQFDRIIKKANLARGVRMSLRSPGGSEQFVFVQHSP